MNKFFAISAAAMMAAAPLAATADQAVRLESTKSSQAAESGVSAFLASSPALAIGAAVIIAGTLFAVVADGSSSSTTLVAVSQ